MTQRLVLRSYLEKILQRLRGRIFLMVAESKEDDLMQEKFPSIYNRLLEIAGKLERHYRDVQDVEFTFGCGNLSICRLDLPSPMLTQ